MQNLSRRDFLARTSSATAALALTPSLFAANGNKKIVAAVMGTNARGLAHIAGLLAVPNVEIAYICDVDDKAIAKGVQAVAKKQSKEPKGVKDFRRILEDKDVDVLTIAAPNHWHAPATILGCSAGKHIYVEKPGSHNPREGELMVKAARKHRRVVQMGNQRRSLPWMKELMERLRAGEIGEVN